MSTIRDYYFEHAFDEDFVKVVRCKECKHWEKRGRCGDCDYGECMAVGQTIDGVLNYVGENHYCGYGEREEQ